MKVLGNWLEREMGRSYGKLFDAIVNKEMPTQVAFMILRMCAVPTVQYWMRTSPPKSRGGWLKDSTRGMETASKILDIADLTTVARYQLSLPVAKGGFGLRSMDAAWVSTLAQGAQYCKRLLAANKLQNATAAPIEQSIERLNTLAG